MKIYRSKRDPVFAVECVPGEPIHEKLDNLKQACPYLPVDRWQTINGVVIGTNSGGCVIAMPMPCVIVASVSGPWCEAMGVQEFNDRYEEDAGWTGWGEAVDRDSGPSLEEQNNMTLSSLMGVSRGGPSGAVNAFRPVSVQSHRSIADELRNSMPNDTAAATLLKQKRFRELSALGATNITIEYDSNLGDFGECIVRCIFNGEEYLAKDPNVLTAFDLVEREIVTGEVQQSHAATDEA